MIKSLDPIYANNEYKLFKQATFFAFIVHVLCAWFSKGAHHFDEQFQILEFLSFKVFGTPSSDLPWEYKEQLRSWFLPMLYYPIVALFKNSSPLCIAFYLRLLTGLGAWLVQTIFFVHCYKQFLNFPYRKLLFYGWHLIWFLPYIHVRPSGENMGGIFFLIGMICFHIAGRDESKKHAILSGSFWGMAFLCRFQMAIPIAVIGILGLVFKKIKVKEALIGVFFIFCFIGIGFLSDLWGYGQWSASFWNYFQFNLVKGGASNFGVNPWYDYFRYVLARGIPPTSLFIMAAFGWFWWKHKKHPATWATFSFFLIHTLIPHKEPRFLFPIASISSIVLFAFLDENKHFFINIYFKGFFKFTIIINCLLVIAITFKNANSALGFYSFMEKEMPQVRAFTAWNENPYTMLGKKLNFYNRKKIAVTTVSDYADLIGREYIFTNTGERFLKLKDSPHCSLKYLSYPMWTLNYNLGDWISRSRVWSFFDCQK